MQDEQEVIHNCRKRLPRIESHLQKARGVRGHGVCTGQKTFSCDQSTSYVGDSQLEKQAHVREKVLIKGFVLNPKDSKQVSNLIRVALRSRISQRWFEKNKLE